MNLAEETEFVGWRDGGRVHLKPEEAGCVEALRSRVSFRRAPSPKAEHRREEEYQTFSTCRKLWILLDPLWTDTHAHTYTRVSLSPSEGFIEHMLDETQTGSA